MQTTLIAIAEPSSSFQRMAKWFKQIQGLPQL